ARADGQASQRRPHRSAAGLRLAAHAPPVQGLSREGQGRQDQLRVRAAQTKGRRQDRHRGEGSGEKGREGRSRSTGKTGSEENGGKESGKSRAGEKSRCEENGGEESH